MTTKELNADIKRLRNRYIKHQKEAERTDKTPTESADYWKEQEAIKEEAKRLYMADREFKYMNREGVLTLLRINTSLRFETPYLFGGNIDLSTL